MTGPSRRAPLPPLPPPPPIPTALAVAIRAAQERLREAEQAVRVVWSAIDQASAAEWPADSRLRRYVLADDAGPEVERRLYEAQRLEAAARVELGRLERDAQRIRQEADNPTPPAPPTPLPQGDRVTPLGRGGSL